MGAVPRAAPIHSGGRASTAAGGECLCRAPVAHGRRVHTPREIDDLCPLPPAPDALPRILDWREARERGISERVITARVSSGKWRRILPRTYLTTDTLTTFDRLDAALVFAGDGAALSGAAALFVSGVRRITVPELILVLTPPDNHTSSAGWVRIRRTLRPFEIEHSLGPRHVPPARAAADLALETRRLDDVRALVARVVQDGHCTLDELGAELDAGPRRGSAHLRKALEEVGWGAASAPEARAARILRGAGITGFVQNAVVRLPNGSTRVVDFYWPDLRACLEIDSVEWHFNQRDWKATLDRHLALSQGGLSVVHLPPSALTDAGKFVADVRAWLSARAAELGVPSMI
jgi:hypothetical protein